MAKKAAVLEAPAPVPTLLTAGQLAQELGCSRSHIFEMASQGRIPHYKVGRLIRFRLGEVLAATKAVSS